jgi:hypothetical protein
VTRQHDDIEIGIARDDQAAIQAHFPDRGHYKAVNHAWERWAPDERLDLPVHQVLVGEPETPGEFEFFLHEVRDGQWHFRRDQSISISVENVTVMSVVGIPVVAPEIQLLYKSATQSQRPRPKDEADFIGILPVLEEERLRRLRALLTAYVPGHAWMERIDSRVTEIHASNRHSAGD